MCSRWMISKSRSGETLLEANQQGLERTGASDLELKLKECSDCMPRFSEAIFVHAKLVFACTQEVRSNSDVHR